jgi:protein TonB
VAAAAPAVVKAARTEAAIDWSSCRRPDYPSESMKRMEEGTTVVKVDLDPTGAIIGSSIAQSSGFPRLDGATQRAVLKCQFRAATVDGAAQASSAMVRIAWALGDKNMLGR